MIVLQLFVTVANVLDFSLPNVSPAIYAVFCLLLVRYLFSRYESNAISEHCICIIFFHREEETGQLSIDHRCSYWLIVLYSIANSRSDIFRLLFRFVIIKDCLLTGLPSDRSRSNIRFGQ